MIPVLHGRSIRTENADLITCSQGNAFSLCNLLLNAIHYNMTHFSGGISYLRQYSAAVVSRFIWKGGVEVVDRMANVMALSLKVYARDCVPRHTSKLCWFAEW